MNRQKFTAIVSTALLLLALIMSIAALRTPLVSLRVSATDESTGDVRRFDEGIYFFSSGGTEKIFFECEVLKKRLLGSAITGLLTSIALSACFVLTLVKLVELYAEQQKTQRQQERQQQQQQHAATSYRKDSKEEEEEADDDTGAHSVAISSHKDSANATAVDRQPPQQQNQPDDGFTSRAVHFYIALSFTFLASVTATLYAWRCLDTECSATFPLYFGLASFSDTASIGPTLGKTDIAVLGPAAPMTSISFAIIIVLIVFQMVASSFDRGCCSVDMCCPQAPQCCRECWRDEEDEMEERRQQQRSASEQQQQQQSRLFRENEAAIRAINEQQQRQQYLDAGDGSGSSSGPLPGFMPDGDSFESDLSYPTDDDEYDESNFIRRSDIDDDDAGSAHGRRSPGVEFVSVPTSSSSASHQTAGEEQPAAAQAPQQLFSRQNSNVVSFQPF